MAQLVDGTFSVALATTAEAIVSTDVVVDWIMLSAHEDNSDTVMVGASTVVAALDETARGVIVPQTVGAAVGSETLPLVLEGPINLRHLYFRVATDTEGIYFLYLQTNN